MRKFFLIVLLTSSLYANPEGMKVVSGSAALTNSQKELTIETGERAILSWEKFSIAKDELTRFNMPSSSSAVLNRVTSREMSQILGKLESNGRVYLLNPNGVIIGKDAYINAASFIASTYDVLDSEFLKNGDLSFSGNSNEKIINLGTVRAFDGDAILIGRYVQNDGSIEAEKGVAALGAGKEILLKPLDKERIYIRPNIESQKEENTGIENNGEIKAVSSYLKADGNLYSLAIKNSGKIDALAFEEKGGEIFLIAENSTVETSGELKAVKESKGGEIRLLGKNVGLLEKAVIDVSHENDGGTVLIGGDYRGKNDKIHNAESLFVG
jgi:filamentous hemagglutinin family protein